MTEADRNEYTLQILQFLWFLLAILFHQVPLKKRLNLSRICFPIQIPFSFLKSNFLPFIADPYWPRRQKYLPSTAGVSMSHLVLFWDSPVLLRILESCTIKRHNKQFFCWCILREWIHLKGRLLYWKYFPCQLRPILKAKNLLLG